tara:strand:+ start:4995 stop:6434 length:1440 start_codon:yes stop_codon:yes gene_type:complete
MPSWKKVIVSGSSPTLNELTLSGDINLAPTNKIQFDGDGGHTYIHEQADDILEIVVGGEVQLKLTEAGNGVEIPVDSHPLKIGAGSDLQFTHNGTNSFIDNYTGTLNITNNTDDGDIILKSDDGSGGTTAYITLDGSAGYTVASKQIRSNDNVALTAGTDGDLNLVHDGTDSYVENWAGDLYIRNNNNDKDIILQSDDGAGGVTAYITLDGSATQTHLHQDTVLTGGKKLYLAGNTYITEASSDILDFYVGGVKMYTIDETNNLLTMRGTGGSDGAAGSPTLRLSNTVDSTDWDTGDVVGALEFYAEDTSGNAPYVTSFIKSVNSQGNGTLPSGYLSFGTSPYNQSGGATEEFRMEEDGDFHAVGDIVAYSSTPSDERLKDNVVTIGNSLDLVSQLRGVRFDWNIGSKEGQQDIGVIAQEIEKVIPEVVSEKKLPLLTGDDKTYKVVDYEKITAVLIESIKELKQEVDEIKQKCDCLNK